MAISIASDLVLDVVKAANPDRARLAQVGLQRGGTVKTAALQFSDVETAVHQKAGIGRFLESDIVADVVNAADTSKRQAGIYRLAGTSGSEKLDIAKVVVTANNPSPKMKAYQQFEASVLRNFVEEMLPKSTESIYGAGTAGNVWRSMQADFMSQQLAKSGGIGIASTLARLDKQKSGASTLNELPQRTSSNFNPITNTSEWPYFSRSEISALES
jgi:peptidoglycan hydrolase FlgJ